jgi:hypothetical protein
MAGTSPAMTEDTPPHSRAADTAGSCVESCARRGRGECRARRRTRSLVCRKVDTRVSPPQVADSTRHSRTRMVLTVSFALAPETGLFCLRRQRNARSIVADLISASGYQAHATSPSASGALRPSHRKRPPHPRPTFVTIAIRPSLRAGTARLMPLILATCEGAYFCGRGWTGDGIASRRGKSVRRVVWLAGENAK